MQASLSARHPFWNLVVEYGESSLQEMNMGPGEGPGRTRAGDVEWKQCIRCAIVETCDVQLGLHCVAVSYLHPLLCGGSCVASASPAGDKPTAACCPLLPACRSHGMTLQSSFFMGGSSLFLALVRDVAAHVGHLSRIIG